MNISLSVCLSGCLKYNRGSLRVVRFVVLLSLKGWCMEICFSQQFAFTIITRFPGKHFACKLHWIFYFYWLMVLPCSSKWVESKYKHVHIHVCMCTIYAHVHVHVHDGLHTYMYMYICTYGHTCTYSYRQSESILNYMYMYIHVYMYTQCIICLRLVHVWVNLV